MKRLVCLKCGSSDIRRSKRHGALEWILKRFFIVPWRCMVCDSRFFRPYFGRILFTRCEIPKLWRMWVTFRTAFRSLSLFAILCFATVDGSSLERARLAIASYPLRCSTVNNRQTQRDVSLYSAFITLTIAE